MNAKGLFNVVLVLSFLFSNLGGALLNPYSDTTRNYAWDFHSFLGIIEAWMEGLRVVRFESGKLEGNGVKLTETPPVGSGIGPTMTPTLTPEPTYIPTATTTITSTITTETPYIPTASAIISPTITPTVEPTVVVTETQPVTLKMIAQPETVTPGYPLSITWQLDGWDNTDNGAEIVLTIPTRVIPEPSQDNAYSWNETDQTIRTPLISSSGQLIMNVAEDARGPFFFLAALHSNGQVMAQAELNLAEEGLTVISPKGGMASDIGGVSAGEAFNQVFGNVNITLGLTGAMGQCTTISSGGCTSGAHQINFIPADNMAFLNPTTQSPGGYRTLDMAYRANRNLVVHELGHAFASQWKDSNPEHPYKAVTVQYKNEEGWAVSPDSASLTWRQHPSAMDDGNFLNGEVFADMFLGWTFDTWGDGPIGLARQDFMNTHMGGWIVQ